MVENLKNIADSAYERYKSYNSDIEKIKEGIDKNRKGIIKLDEIHNDPQRLARRIEMEGLPFDEALERINGVPNFQDIFILRKILRLSQSIGRITIKSNFGTTGYGTGFIIAPGIILTNHHVFPNTESARNSYIQFNYEISEKGDPVETQTFSFLPDRFFMTSSFKKNPADPFSGLDFTVVAISEKSKEGKSSISLPVASLNNLLGKILEGENCVVIQHPKGDYKKIVLKDIRMISLADDFLIYESDTLPGSSGAMVVGLGTGEVVALHHSGVPRKNARGEWLKKDGGVVMPGDPDHLIDWIGNEGIRISSLVRAMKAITLSEEMDKIRTSMIATFDILANTGVSNLKQGAASVDREFKEDQQTFQTMPIENNTALKAKSLINEEVITHGTDAVQYFEIELAPHTDMQQDWKENYKRLVPGIVSTESVFPLSTVPAQRRTVYATIRSNENPWELAAKLEALPQVTTATPDLPMETDVQYQYVKSTKTNFESSPLESTNDGTAEWNEDKFISSWSASKYFNVNNLNHPDTGKDEQAKMRMWNRKCVNMPAFDEKNPFPANINKIRLVQLDTGYTDNSKVKGGFDLENDEDFIDGNDARDEMSSGLLQHPGHGTRTASILIGGKSTFKSDGNMGILFDDQRRQPMLQVIPYRVAQSVILIGRGKYVVDAVNHAISTNADVMFMCMGSYPRNMIYEAAKAAYDNGIIWVCAAGNEVESVIAPAMYPGTIAVAAVNPLNMPWSGTSYGDVVDIAAPGEDVYVPFINKDYDDIMVYGSGTSYATPHVAAAASLWKAKFLNEINEKCTEPWQIVELFRYCLKKSANKNFPHWERKFGEGILDIKALLKNSMKTEIQNATLVYAYNDKPNRPEWDLGIREAVHFLWQTLRKKLTPGFESSAEMALTERARISISSITDSPAISIFESTSPVGTKNREKILNMYFESYKK